MVRPARLERATFWFVDTLTRRMSLKNNNDLRGVQRQKPASRRILNRLNLPLR